jgi:RNase adaptor protein for sRNA GlmZ degradation
MSAVLITGMSGAGKSTIAGVPARGGLFSIDADADPLLARSVDCDGTVVDDSSSRTSPGWPGIAGPGIRPAWTK